MGGALGDVENGAAGAQRQVGHEPAADGIIAVAETGRQRAGREQQQAGILQAPGQDEDTGRDAGPGAVRSGQDDGPCGHPAVIRFDLQDMGMEEDGAVPVRVGQGLAVDLSEPGRWTFQVDLLPEVAAERDPALGESSVLPGPVVGINLIRMVGGKLAVGERLGVDRIQLVPAERPAAVGNPGPSFEVPGIERRAVTTPVAGGAAELAQPGPHRVDLPVADAASLVEGLNLVLQVEAAAVEQGDAVALVLKFQGERDPGGARPDRCRYPFPRLIRCPAALRP